MVYDFAEACLRVQKPEDRLLATTQRPYTPFAAPKELLQAIETFSVDVKTFFLIGGKDFDPISSQDDPRLLTETPECKELRKKIIKDWQRIITDPASAMLRAMATILCADNTDLNDMIFQLRTDARVLATGLSQSDGRCPQFRLSYPK